MGFCDEGQVQDFFEEVPQFENMLVRDGIRLFKFWLTVGREEQLLRFYQRKTNPLKKWKLSPIDVKSLSKWNEYTAAIKDLLIHTHTETSPWTVIKSNDKRRAHLSLLRSFLSRLDYEDKDAKLVDKPDPKITLTGESFISQT